MPEIIEGQQVQNDLDRQLRFYRESELEYIRKVATRLRESATDVQEALQEVEHFLAQLKNLTVEVRVGTVSFFDFPPSAPRLGNQRPWYVQPRLCDWAYKRSRATYRKEKGIVSRWSVSS